MADEKTDLPKERELNAQLLQQPQIIDVISYANTVGTETPQRVFNTIFPKPSRGGSNGR